MNGGMIQDPDIPMTVFDYIIFNGEIYQTKDTPKKLFNKYKIAFDKETDEYKLYREDDRIKYIIGFFEKSSFSWTFCDNFTGELTFYRNLDEHTEMYYSYFHNGILIKIDLVEV